MSPPSIPPRLPQRASSKGDQYVWLGVLWLVILGVGFLMLVMMIAPILNYQVISGILSFIGLNVAGHMILGRWVARRIAAAPPDDDLTE